MTWSQCDAMPHTVSSATPSAVLRFGLPCQLASGPASLFGISLGCCTYLSAAVSIATPSVWRSESLCAQTLQIRRDTNISE